MLLVDTDPQGSASYWASSRDEDGVKPRVACIQKFGKGLQGEVQDLAGRYEDIVIDAGGRDSVELRAAMVVAQKAFVPIQASQFDIWTLGRMNDLVVTAQGFNADLRAWVVISRGSTNPLVAEIAEAREILEDFEHLALAENVIRDRIAYRKAARDGFSVTEMQPADPKASAEMNALYAEIFNDDQQVTQQTPIVNADEFIAGAEQRTAEKAEGKRAAVAANRELRQAKIQDGAEPSRPWEDPHVREDVFKVYNLRYLSHICSSLSTLPRTPLAACSSFAWMCCFPPSTRS